MWNYSRYLDIFNVGKKAKFVACPPAIRKATVVQSLQDFYDLAAGLERSLFVTGPTLALSAFIEERTSGLSVYHGLTVINLCQIIAWSGLLLRMVLGFYKPQFSLYLCVTSTALMSAFGLYFYMDMEYFAPFGGAQMPSSPCTPSTGTFYLFHGVVEISQIPCHDPPPELGLYCEVIAYYLFCSLPFLNLALMLAAPFLAVSATLLAFYIILTIKCALQWLILRPSNFVFQPMPITGAITTALFGAAASISFCSPLLYAIITTEYTIHLNRNIVQADQEGRWTYGQMLALSGAVVGMALYSLEFRNIRRKRKERRRYSRLPASTQDPIIDQIELQGRRRISCEF
ncbi:hypothetical protein H0H92_010417 [Tricholoma furcatifolium]|nr:hypothetical protein H0H92_010417 [Tricholoma furcatifolium]